MRLHKTDFTAKTVSCRSKRAADGNLDSDCALEDDMYTAGVYDEEEDVDAKGGMTFYETVHMLTLGLEDGPVATSEVLQIN
jgi:hypothetical protein